MYSLNFSCLSSFSDKLKFLDDKTKERFQAAISGNDLKKISEETSKTILPLLPIQASLGEQVSNYINSVKKIIEFADSLLSEYAGSNPYAIQQLVHEILGICKSSELEDAQRQTYLDLLIKTGFLSSEYDFVNGKEATADLPDTGSLASTYLTDHPEVTRLALGCGKAANLALDSCCIRRAEDHAQQLFTIDLSMSINPDLMTDMHDVNFWKGIPNGRLEAILDHTYGNFLFDSANSEQTIQQIFRCLKPGGYLQMDHWIEDSDAGLLRKIGFVVENGATKVARKPQ